jgi:hypothetical protein
MQRVIKGALILLFALLTPVCAQSQATGPAQIILLRHAEEPADPDNPHLSPAGVARANALVPFIRTDPTMARFGPPVAVFASKATKRDNGQRSQETVAPLAKALGLPVQTPYLARDYKKLAKRILANPVYAGKTVIISWTHEDIPEFASALGVKPRPPKWKGSVYDQVYVISYQNGNPTLATFHYNGK